MSYLAHWSDNKNTAIQVTQIVIGGTESEKGWGTNSVRKKKA